MAGTITSEVTSRSGGWAFFYEVEGWGRRINASASARRDTYLLGTLQPYRHGYTADEAEPYIVAAMGRLSTVGERINLRTSATLLGSVQLTLADTPVVDYDGSRLDHGWGDRLLTDLLAVQGPAHLTHSIAAGRWLIDEDIDSTETSWTMASVTGIATGDALWIEGEVVIVTGVVGVTLAVLRGQYGTTAKHHRLISDGGEGLCYDRPQYLRGRGVKVWATKYDTRARTSDGRPKLLAETERLLIWQGTVSDWATGGDGASLIQIACKPAMGKLDRTIGREQLTATVTPDASWSSRRDDSIPIRIQVPEGPGEVTSLGYDFTGAGVARKQEFYARLGEQLVICEHYESDSAIHTVEQVQVTQQGLLDTDPSAGTSDKSVPFHDVLVCLPSPLSFFHDGGGDPTTDPVDIILALVTSTGAGTNGDWDMLPIGADHDEPVWGVGYPIGDINTDSFRNIRGRHAGASLARVVLGWEGKPIPLRRWIEEHIFAPRGLFFYMAMDSQKWKLHLGEITDIYPDQDLPTVDEGDILDGSWKMTGQLGQTTTLQTWRLDGDLATGKPRATRKYRDATWRRYPDDDAELRIEALDVANDSGGTGAIDDRADGFSTWWRTPQPLVSFILRLSRLEISVVEGISLTCPNLPNPYTGERGLTSVNAVVLGAQPTFEGGEVGIKISAMLLPSRNVGLWAPSATVRSWDSATNEITVEENDYSMADGHDSVPAVDAAGFVATDILMLLNRFGNIVSASSRVVSSVAGNMITLTAGAAWTPVPGDVVTLAHYASGGTPAATWTTRMKQHVAQGDDADDLLVNGDAAYVYGV